MNYSLSSWRRTLRATLVITLLIQTAFGLQLHEKKESPYDLALKGRLVGLAPGETRYLKWAELRELPNRKIVLEGEFVPGKQEVTAVMLSDILAMLPREAQADSLIATCTDGYASIYNEAFLTKYKPFLVLEINGKGPEQWPPEGLKFNPGPYVISITEVIVPEAKTLLDAGHKRPWGVDTLEFVNYADRFAGFYKGALANPSDVIKEGRELWVNSCFSCHNQPEKNLGGTKAAWPMQIVATHATHNAAYFRDYVRNPTKLNPMAKMEPHPHYTDAQLNALIEFLKVTMATP